MGRGVAWESVRWRCGNDQYSFDIERGGLFATLAAPGGRRLTLPMAVWDGLLDALRANRTTRARTEQQQYPTRARARWYDGEIQEVLEAYKSGRSIGEIATAHHRSAHAIEHQLDRLGLISTAELYAHDRRGEPMGESRPRPPPGQGDDGVYAGHAERLDTTCDDSLVAGNDDR